MQETWRKVLTHPKLSRSNNADENPRPKLNRYFWERNKFGSILVYLFFTLVTMMIGAVIVLTFPYWPSHVKAQNLQQAREDGWKKLGAEFFPKVKDNQISSPVWSSNKEITVALNKVKLQKGVTLKTTSIALSKQENLASNKLYIQVFNLPAGTALLEICGRQYWRFNQDFVHCEYHGWGREMDFWSHAEDAKTIEKARAKSKIPFPNTKAAKDFIVKKDTLTINDTDAYATMRLNEPYPTWLIKAQEKGKWPLTSALYNPQSMQWNIISEKGLSEQLLISKDTISIPKREIIAVLGVKTQSLSDHPTYHTNAILYSDPEVV